MSQIQDQIIGVMREIFDRPELVWSDQMSANDVEEWDSLSHINLIVALEKEFKIRFTLEEIRPLKNCGEMAALVAKKTLAA